MTAISGPSNVPPPSGNEPLSISTPERRPVWCRVYVPRAYGVVGETVLERRWVDTEGRQWATDDRPLDPAPIVEVERG